MSIDDYIEKLLKNEKDNQIELQALGYYDPSYDKNYGTPINEKEEQK